jgi:hypothetical protein
LQAKIYHLYKDIFFLSIFVNVLNVVRGPGHKHEKFMAGVFTQIKHVWIDELETRPKTLNNLWLGLIFLFLSANFF